MRIDMGSIRRAELSKLKPVRRKDKVSFASVPDKERGKQQKKGSESNGKR
ncbi:MAG: hypothetical protein HDQ88_02945 [Clostridia bacterium]|nr:hypothetical protein [Clostridia bacterium]